MRAWGGAGHKDGHKAAQQMTLWFPKCGISMAPKLGLVTLLLLALRKLLRKRSQKRSRKSHALLANPVPCSCPNVPAAGQTESWRGACCDRALHCRICPSPNRACQNIWEKGVKNRSKSSLFAREKKMHVRAENRTIPKQPLRFEEAEKSLNFAPKQIRQPLRREKKNSCMFEAEKII